MVDTVRTLAALQALLADNTSGDISPQDIRDFLVSVYGFHLIEEQILGADAATVSLTGIPAIYSDLLLVSSLRSTRVDSTVDELNIRFGTGGGARDTGANYDSLGQRFNALGATDATRRTAATSAQASRFALPTDDIATTDYFGAHELRILSYAATDKFKTYKAEDGFASDDADNLGAAIGQCTGTWRNAGAIDSFDLFFTNGDVKAGSELRLWGFV